MKTPITWLTLVAAGIFATACSEFEEPQIDNDTIQIITPRDGLQTTIASQLFFWEFQDGALEYELQIVTPSFDLIDQFILDTTTTGNKFRFTLSPGQYEWRVRGYNNSSATAFTYATLVIDSTADLSGIDLILTGPGDNDTSNSLSQTFSWQDLYNADQYRFELWSPDISGTLSSSAVVTASPHKDSATAEGPFLWRVRAENNLGNTVYSVRNIYLDTTKPGMPNLSVPANGATITDTVTFSWTRGSNTGSSLIDKLILSSDSTFSTIWLEDSTRTRTYLVDTLQAGTYYWKVRSRDKAGNIGKYSNFRTFTQQ